MQRPVERFQILTIPSESLVIVTPSCVCRVMDFIAAEVRDADFGSASTGSDGIPICQNLTDWSWDAEIREEEDKNAREVMSSVCPMKVSVREGSELVMSQI